MKKVGLLLFWLLASTSLMAQEGQRLSFEDYMQWVQDYHPIAIQADLNLRLGQMEVRKARGGFDPMVYGNLDKKEFNQSTYFEKREAGLVVPTWMGVELMGSFEQNNGAYLNSENAGPNNGMLSAGAAVNLGQGLILDDRRATLQKAQLYEQATEVERLNFRNDLNLQATAAYWKWAAAYENKLVLEEGVKLAKIRFDGIKRSYELGDQAAIDTVEALSQLLNRQYRLQLAENSFFENTQVLNTYLWNESGEPMLLESAVIPQALSQFLNAAPEAEELRALVGRHPELLLTDFDLASLNVERRLKTQELLPVVKLKYNFLTETVADARPSPLFENNYKWGIDFKMPIFIREGRGEYKKSKLKIAETNLELSAKRWEIENKIKNYYTETNLLQQQITIAKKAYSNYNVLLKTESLRFANGESSLFLVNSRENKLIEILQKQVELTIKYFKAKYAIDWASGSLR